MKNVVDKPKQVGGTLSARKRRVARGKANQIKNATNNRQRVARAESMVAQLVLELREVLPRIGNTLDTHLTVLTLLCKNCRQPLSKEEYAALKEFEQKYMGEDNNDDGPGSDVSPGEPASPGSEE
jgi:uncharacterized membrane protein